MAHCVPIPSPLWLTGVADDETSTKTRLLCHYERDSTLTCHYERSATECRIQNLCEVPSINV